MLKITVFAVTLLAANNALARDRPIRSCEKPRSWPKSRSCFPIM